MLQRLQNVEIARINREYSNDVFYKAIKMACSHYETEMSHFALCPEEVFVECSGICDEILDRGEDYDEHVPILWDKLYNGYRRLDRSVPEEEICLATTVVLICVCIALSTSKYPYYADTLPFNIMKEIAARNTDWHKVHVRLLDDFEDYHESICGWLDMRLDSVKVSCFEKYITRKNAVDKVLALLHQHIDPQQKGKPKKVLKALRAAMDAGVLARPDLEDFSDEFKEVSKSRYEDLTNMEKDPHPYNNEKDYEELKKQFEKL